MALSHEATTVAILRRVLGPIHGQEKRFAKIVGKSVSWVKKVSAGLTPLSEDSARVLEAATGIALAWLLEGDTQKQPVSAAGKPYTMADYQSHRAALESGSLDRISVIAMGGFLPKLAAIGSAAGKKGKASLFHWRLKNFLNECRDEFGFDKEAEELVMVEQKKAKLPYMAFCDAYKDPITGVTTTFRILDMEDSEPIFEPETQRSIHSPKKH